MSDVTTTRAEYDENLPLWAKLADVCKGQEAVKSKRTEYLPMPQEHDQSDENKKRYDQYLTRAIFYGFTERTLTSMVGMATKAKPDVMLPPQLERHKENVNGEGLTVEQFASLNVERTLNYGHGGIFVDYVATNDSVKVRDQSIDRIRAVAKRYEGRHIINWNMEQRGGEMVYTLFVLQEVVHERKGFAIESVEQHRVLSLDPDGVYRVYIYRDAELVEQFEPRDAQGRTLNFIPFIPVGAKNNDMEIDKSPMLNIANVNIGHYINSADAEESSFIHGQPTLVASGLTEQWVENVLDGNFCVGSRGGIPLPEGANAQLLQASENSQPQALMRQKEELIVALGAFLLEEGSAAKTAAQSNNEAAIQHSVLSLVVENVAAAIKKALGYIAMFEGASGEIVFDMSTDFAAGLTPQERAQYVAEYNAGLLPKADVWSAYRKAGVIAKDRSDEDLSDELDIDGENFGTESAGFGDE